MTACSTRSRQVGEPLAGTAPRADAWVVLEQPGPWGARALRDADLPAGLGAILADAAASTRVGILLARHPSRPARQADGRRHAWVADVRPGSERLHHGLLDDISSVADWDFAGLATGDLPTLDGPSADPLLLACTQGGRDACCATIGRPLLAAVHEHLGVQQHLAWEASHIGGHRFAPTLLVLPTGAVYGRLDPAAAVSALRACADGRITGDGLRGRTGLSPQEQVAEIAVRAHLGGESALADFEVRESPAPDGTDAEVTARHADGRFWTVRLRHERLDALRPESCGGDPRPVHAWQVAALDPS
ncbi:MAG: hypothetical protein KGP12_10740 [Actinomycetales bacterium]|nr:hypothetical protein [Actinomycetales bacterium]